MIKYRLRDSTQMSKVSKSPTVIENKKGVKAYKKKVGWSVTGERRQKAQAANCRQML